MWLASVMPMTKRRCACAASNTAGDSARRRKPSSTSRTVAISASACGVGCMPEGVRTNSGSPICARSLLSQIDTVGLALPQQFGGARDAAGGVEHIEQAQQFGVKQ
jgi:hypothetical protein